MVEVDVVVFAFTFNDIFKQFNPNHKNAYVNSKKIFNFIYSCFNLYNVFSFDNNFKI